MFGSSESQYRKQERYRSIVNRVEASTWGQEPTKVIDSVISSLERPDLKKPASKFLKDASRAVAASAFYRASGRAQQHEEDARLPDDELLNAVDEEVSTNAETGFENLSSFLGTMAVFAEALEKDNRFTLDAQKKIRNAIAGVLRQTRAEQKETYPTLQELMDGLERKDV